VIRRLVTAGAAAVAAVMLVEVVLQCLAFGVWLRHREDRRRGGSHEGAETVLCLGDSYTFGMGASSPDRSYPWSGAFGEQAVRAVATELDVPWVPVFEELGRAREEQPDVELFVHDGHCNDAGYDLMAEAFAREIVRLESGPGSP
jgi:lysophospholipase L1-like esterase